MSLYFKNFWITKIIFILFKKISETDNAPKKSMKKQVSFGENEQIPYDPPVHGGYAHAAVKVAKRNHGRNKRRTFELILRPDNFSVDLVIENPSGLNSPVFVFDE